MIDWVTFGGQKDCLHAENGGLRNGIQQDLNKMIDMDKFWGAKRSSRCRKWGAKPWRIPTDSQRGSAPPKSLKMLLSEISNFTSDIVWPEACSTKYIRML